MMMNIGDGRENPPVVMCGITLSATVWDATRGNLLVGSRYLGNPPPLPLIQQIKLVHLKEIKITSFHLLNNRKRTFLFMN